MSGAIPERSRSSAGTSRADERRAQAVPLRARDVRLDVVPHHPRELRLGSSASSAASKYTGLGLPMTTASTPAAYSSPATKAPESSRGPRDVCHQRFLCRQ